jgi:hypothetical protein
VTPPAVITKLTGHPFDADDLRYLDERQSRGNWQFRRLGELEITQLVGKNRRIFISDTGGAIIRLAPETHRVRGKDGILRERKTGKISEAYADHLLALQAQGKQVYERVVVGVKELTDDHGYVLAHERGTLMPATWTTRIRAQELNWNPALKPPAAMQILARVIRESIKPHMLIRRAVKTITSRKKVGRTIVSHNLVIAPHPRLLAQIRRAGQPIDAMLEVAARRALEKMEHKIGGKIVAVCSTHLEDSTTVRPHLHVRMSAYTTNGKYISLFDRKAGGAGGNRCLLQPEVERQVRTMIERWEPRGRN